MKRATCILLGCFFLTNCKHQISRIDYNIDKSSLNYTECDLPIKKYEQIPDSVATKIGTIWLSDTGFSNKCDTADAAIILKKEGCALGADFVNIFADREPDEESVCYRCQADFYEYREEYNDVF